MPWHVDWRAAQPAQLAVSSPSLDPLRAHQQISARLPSLSRHILPEALQAAHDAKAKRQTGHPASESTKKAAASHRSVHHASPYAGRYQATADVPKFSLPEKGVNPKTAYHLCAPALIPAHAYAGRV